MAILTALLVLVCAWQTAAPGQPSPPAPATARPPAPTAPPGSAVARRSPDIAFGSRMIDPGAFESAAVADINNDGRLDILSGDSWYEAPAWRKHTFREVGFSGNYLDSFSMLPVDVDGDGYVDIADVSWFARRIAWWKNPGRSGVAWIEGDVYTGGNVEFAVLGDIDNDGRALEIVAQQNGTPQAWFEARGGAWVRHVVSDRTYGHGIGVGDVNGDRRNDILTPRGWLEAPADPRSGDWTFHPAWALANAARTAVEAAGTAPASADPGPVRSAAVPDPLTMRIEELGFMHVLDVNADGRLDVITAAGHDYGVIWFEQGGGGQWTRRVIDAALSQGHSSTLIDLNNDGRLDLVTGKRLFAHNGGDPGAHDPLGVFWYEFRRLPPAAGRGGRGGSGGPTVDWVRHLIEYGGRIGAGMQTPVVDLDGDGDLDIVCPGKSGLFVLENLTAR